MLCEEGCLSKYLGKQSSRWQMLGSLRRYLHESKMSELFEGGDLEDYTGRAWGGINHAPSKSQL